MSFIKFPVYMLRARLIIFFIVFLNLAAEAQENDIDFLTSKVIIDYPGFAEKISENDFREFVGEMRDLYGSDTFKTLSAIVSLFNDQHLQVYQPQQFVTLDSEKCNRELKIVESYLRSRTEKHKWEGYWLNDYNDCVVGVKMDENSSESFTAYVLENSTGKLLPGMSLGRFGRLPHSKDGDVFFTDYFSPFTGARHYVFANFRNDSVFTTGADGKWKKLRGYSKPILNRLPKFNYRASGYCLNDSTYVLRIPGSTRDNVRIIDSVIKCDFEKIIKRPNLILDIRNNLGGTIKAYASVVPVVCTGPIVRPGLLAYCTKDDITNAKRDIQNYLDKGQVDSNYLSEWLSAIKLQEDSIGKFIQIEGDTIACTKTMKYPRNVGIIINYACQSAAELMLLDLRQSEKVTIFGEHSMGAVDYLDFYPMELPSGKYRLYIPTTKRLVTDRQPSVDGRGIYPDVNIDDSEPDWINFVVRHYEKH